MSSSRRFETPPSETIPADTDRPPTGSSSAEGSPSSRGRTGRWSSAPDGGRLTTRADGRLSVVHSVFRRRRGLLFDCRHHRPYDLQKPPDVAKTTTTRLNLLTAE